MFRFLADNNVAQKFWTDMEIPYLNVAAVEIADRTVSTFEGIVGGVNSRQLNQKNNINFSFVGPDGPTVLRVEMLTGVTVMGQAKKCHEFEDRLRSYQIRERFGAGRVTSSADSQGFRGDGGSSLADELAKLASLRDQGILSEYEFETQKNKFLQ
jgi:Short C-terminal domain